ncbi:unnamed protein product [Mycena citricolor]|uniref:Uncharacterized protein n=1 Tax=Mycena citricolor TaxID=2018698 RepID=A0AAD2HBG9_9AGAR|nr:unnamed protein product [Mycena citricolor]
MQALSWIFPLWAAPASSTAFTPGPSSDAVSGPTPSEDILNDALDHPVLTCLRNLVTIGGGGAWPPRSSPRDTWPTPLRAYDTVYRSMAPLFPTPESSTDDAHNRVLIDAYRGRMRELLAEHVVPGDVCSALDHAESDPESCSQRAWLGIWLVLSFLRHSYRWGVTPIVSEAQNEYSLDFPEELDEPWRYIQKHFGTTSPGGCMTSLMYANLREDSTLEYSVTVGLSDEHRKTELWNAKLVCGMEERLLPMYHLFTHAMIYLDTGEFGAAQSALHAANEILRDAFKFFFGGMVHSNLNQKLWLAYVQGYQGWTLGGIDGISGGQSFAFRTLDSFLGIRPFPEPRKESLHLPTVQRDWLNFLRDYDIRDRAKAKGDEAAGIVTELESLVKQLRLWRMGHMKRMQPYESVHRPERKTMTAGISVVNAANEDLMIEHLKQQLGQRCRKYEVSTVDGHNIFNRPLPNLQLIPLILIPSFLIPTTMAILDSLFTLLQTTFFSILTLFLRPFDASHDHAIITPYPLVPDLENRVIDISAPKAVSRKRASTDVLGPLGNASCNVNACYPVALGPARRRYTVTIPFSPFVMHQAQQPLLPLEWPPKTVSSFKVVSGAYVPNPFHAKLAHPLPVSNQSSISLVTCKVSVLPAGKENRDGHFKQTSKRKLTPLRRMPRYLNLAGSSPSKMATKNFSQNVVIRQHSQSDVKSRRATILPGMEYKTPTKTKTLWRVNASPDLNSPLKFQYGWEPAGMLTPRRVVGTLGPADRSPDLAARVWSIFYKHRDGASEQETDCARDVFSRDSLRSEMSVLSQMVKNLDVVPDNADDDAANAHGSPLTPRSGYSPTSSSSCSSSSSPSSSTLGSPVSRASTELAYMCAASQGRRPWPTSAVRSFSPPARPDCASETSSSSRAVFYKDFLTGEQGFHSTTRHWEPAQVGAWLRQEEHWSDVLCLEEYVR